MFKSFSHIIILTFSALLIIASISSSAETYDNEWKQHETLTNRLSSEWYRIGILQNDLDDINDLLSDLVDFEIYPQSVTGLNDEDIVTIDRNIEVAQKARINIQSELDKIKLPLSDDIEILREMAAGTPVESMFDVLTEGDMMRISELIEIKHKIDNLRKKSDSLLTTISILMNIQIPEESSKYSEESDFIEILTANLGLYSEVFYQKINNVKTELTKRASGSEIEKMYKVEMFQIKKIINQQSYRIADRKLVSLLKRYKSKINPDEIYSFISISKFGLKNYLEAINSANKINDNSRYSNKKDLILIQSWYALQKFEKIKKWKITADLFKFTNQERNLLLWLIIESELIGDPETDHSKYIELVDMESLFSINVLHSIARSYFLKGQHEVAISILKKVTNKEIPNSPIELQAYEKAKSTMAKILFEMKDYKGSLETFFSLINSQLFFEDALFGMAWCYIKLNSYTKAEATLRKLINQSPESTEAAEAMLIMSKRFISKAQHEWDKIQYYYNEEKRVGDALKKLDHIINYSTSESKKEMAVQAKKDLKNILIKLKAEERSTPEQIKRLYDQGLKITEIVNTNYETGSFKEFVFTEERETILHKLDSLIYSISDKETIKESGKKNHFKENIIQIKQVVKKSDIIKTEFLLDQYKWSIDHINWLKRNIRDSINTLKKLSIDSTKKENLLNRQKILANRIDSLIVSQGQFFKTHYNTIVNRSLSLLKTDLSPEDESFIRYNLGELYYKDENLKFAKEFSIYEEKLLKHDSLYTLFSEGKIDTLPLEPPRPKLSHTRSMQQFKISINKFPNDDLIAAHRYSLAWCYNDLAVPDSAVYQMSLIANKYPNSQYSPQAWMFLGEYYFDNANLDNAVSSYKSVMRYPESRWFDNALYKLAWTQYRLSNPEKAISSFLALVDLGKGIKGGKALLESESIDYIAISFSESDVTGERGLSRAKIFCRKLNSPEKGTKILHRLATVYEEQGRFKMAIKSYNTLLSMYPNYDKNPKVESDLIAVMSRELPLEKSNELKMEYFTKYNRKGKWALKQKDKRIISLADSTASIQLYDASVAYHRIALEKNDTTQYNKALNAYKLFIHHYPKNSKANECHYNMAEILFSTGRYHKAAEEYIAVSKRYPDSKYRETAAWNAIVASQTLLKNEKENK